jgi:hypothetical protein
MRARWCAPCVEALPLGDGVRVVPALPQRRGRGRAVLVLA